jgi:hypothetical protein
MLTARRHRYSLWIVFALSRLAPAQEAIPLTVQPGVALHVELVKPVPVKQSGVAVEGRLAEPIFVFDRMVIPAGSQILGHVGSPVRAVVAQPVFSASIDAEAGAHMQVEREGGVRAVTPKTNVIAPAIDVVLALGSLDGLDPHRKLHPGFHHGPDTVGGTVRGGAGFGLVGSVIGLAAHYRPVSATFAFYGAGWSVYTHFVAPGNDVVFPKNTPMEIRFGTHQDPAPAAPNQTPASVKAGAGGSDDESNLHFARQ